MKECPFLNLLINFLNSTFFQSVLVGLSIYIPIKMFSKKRTIEKQDELKNAANILILQIEDIEENINQIKCSGIDGTDNAILERPMHYSKIIFEKNYWDVYNHLFNQLSVEARKEFNSFFSNAERIKKQQIYIKGCSEKALDIRAAHYYNSLYSALNCKMDETLKISPNMQGLEYVKNVNSKATEVGVEIEQRVKKDFEHLPNLKKIIDLYYNNFSVATFIPLEYQTGLINSLKEYKPLSESKAFEELKKIAAKTSFFI